VQKRGLEIAARIEALADERIIDRIVDLITLLEGRQKAAEGWPAEGGGSTSVN
jgi:hypothetical protein